MRVGRWDRGMVAVNGHRDGLDGGPDDLQKADGIENQDDLAFLGEGCSPERAHAFEKITQPLDDDLLGSRQRDRRTGDTDGARIERIVPRQCALAALCFSHRHTVRMGERMQGLRSFAVQYASAGNHQRAASADTSRRP